jgi:hypothetical protein
VYASTRNLVYGGVRRGDPSLWAPLLEKAFAKLNGSYDGIGHGGFAANVMFAMTGWSSYYYAVNDNNAGRLTNALPQWLEQGAVMMLSSNEHGADFGVRLSNHAYSVFSESNNPNAPALILRNPLGGGANGVFKFPITRPLDKTFRTVVIATPQPIEMTGWTSRMTVDGVQRVGL